jgi:hypothetical protein
VIQQLQSIHNDIAKQKAKSQGAKVRLTSSHLFKLKDQLQRQNDNEEKKIIQERIAEIQREMANDIEAKDKASQVRIENFRKTNIGKITPATYYAVKERHQDRRIHKLQHQGREITDQAEIIEIMQKWYEQTAERTLPQTTC